jgi:HlyD family secretion protein
MKKQATVITGILVGIGVAAILFVMIRSKVRLQADVRMSQPEYSATNFVAGPGRVEPLSEDIKVGSEINGKLKALLVEESDRVELGQVLAILQNDDYQAQVASAKADLVEKEADFRKIMNGARTEERQEALACVNEAQAILENARAEMQCRQRLYQDGVLSREEADRYEREFKVAKARYDATAEHYALLEHPPREEDRARGKADVALARARLDEAHARYEKTSIRSRLGGVVLRKYHHPSAANAKLQIYWELFLLAAWAGLPLSIVFHCGVRLRL